MSLQDFFEKSTTQLTRAEKQILRVYFNIKSITQSRIKDGYVNVEEYYLFLKNKKKS